MSEFVFLYRGGQRPTSPQEGQQVMQKWMAWFKDLAARGHVVDRGQPLERSGKLVRGNKSVTDGPFAEAKDVIGGYTLIKANDIAQAAELAKGCPVLERGGQGTPIAVPPDQEGQRDDDERSYRFGCPGQKSDQAGQPPTALSREVGRPDQ